MKKIISVALVMVMVVCCFTACGTIVEPNVGTYTDTSGTLVVEVGEYDGESGTMKMYNTINDTNSYEGTYVLEQNESGVSSIITFTTTEGSTVEFVYDSTMDAMQDLDSATVYYGPNAE
ncbi:MAG: hypothetical protein LUH03_07375 [Oscillospiraceae bacterium]|nr:hypothetical protein [Oscillospiraceae bacterium]